MNNKKTIELAPVIHARWIKYPEGLYICNKCMRPDRIKASYCHHCGAKMDKDIENE